MTAARANLPPATWSRLLLDDSNEASVAAAVTTGRVLPWTELLLRSLQDATTVLDLGSGRGELAAALALNGKKVTLLDWSSENLAFSRNVFERLGVGGRFVQADMTRPLPFGTSAFDAVYSCGVLEFFSDTQIMQALAESWRVSTRRLITFVPNAWSLPYRLGKWYMERTGAWEWDGEVPFRSLRPFLVRLDGARVVEFSVAPRHALKFLQMPAGRYVRGIMSPLFPTDRESGPALARQGYLLFTRADRV